jgi:hypothetical protein
MSPEPVGSLAEEAAKLVSALSSMQNGAHDESHDPLAAECRYCPLCAAVRAARSMTPEVREHLASAATSLVLALKGLLEEAVASAPDETPVEKIDLAED